MRFDICESNAEIFKPNSWYGSAKILKQFSNWHLPLPYVVPHAPGHSSYKTWDAELDSSLPGYYLFPSWRKRNLEKKTNKKIILGASPWLYLISMQIKKNQNKKYKKKGSIVFPPHSTHLINAEMDHYKFIKILKKSSRKYYPLTICFYWRDIQLKKHLPYINNGFRVVSAGHMFNENFFENLINIFAKKEYLITNNYGSHIFYGASAGLKVIFTKEVNYFHSGEQQIIDRDSARPDLSIYGQIDSIFFHNNNFLAQKQFSNSVLGAEYIKSKIQLLCEILFLYFKNPFFLSASLKHFRTFGAGR